MAEQKINDVMEQKLKERLYGLTNSEENHGEDVKEYYFCLDRTPTHSYLKSLCKYPQREYPWYAAWDLAVHMVSLALVDFDFAKEQLTLRSLHFHPSGQIPAYEWNISTATTARAPGPATKRDGPVWSPRC